MSSAHVVQSEHGATPASTAAVEQEAHAAGERAAAGRDARVALAAPPGQALHAPPDLAKPAGTYNARQPELTSRWYTLDGFATNKAELTAAHLAIIDHVAKDLAREPLQGGFITVIGHADAVGSSPDNKVLGQLRASAVRSALINKGIPLGDVHAGSLGEDAMDVNTRKAEPKNRGVEIMLNRRHVSLGAAPTAGTSRAPAPTAAAPTVDPAIGEGAPSGTAGAAISPRASTARTAWRQEFEQRILDLAIKYGAKKDSLFDQAVNYLDRNNGPLIANQIADLAERRRIDRAWAKEQVRKGIKKGIEALLAQGPQAIVVAVAGPPSERPASETGPALTERAKPTIVSLPVPFPGDQPARANPTNATVHVTNHLSATMTKMVFKRGESISFDFTTPPSFAQLKAVIEIVPAREGAAVRTLNITRRRSGSASFKVPDSAGPFVLQVTLVGSEPHPYATFHFSME
jgi:outer membrane protein OmpA-like peptidoglycan-associated protein